MKKILTLLLFSWASFSWGTNVLENVTSTTLSTQIVDTTKNDPWAVGADGKAHRFRSDNTGALVMGAGSSATITGTVAVRQDSPWNVSGSVSASITGSATVTQGSPWTVSGSVRADISGTAIPLWLTFTASTPSEVKYATITFTAVTADVTGVTIVAAVAGKTIAVVGYGISASANCAIVLHHQGGAVVRSNTASNMIGGGRIPGDGGERSGASVLFTGLAPGQPVCADFDVTGSGTIVEVVVAFILL